MKRMLQKLGMLILVSLSALQVQANNWTNLSNFTDITDIAVNGNQVWVSAKGGLMLYDKSTGSKTFFKKTAGQLPSLSVERVALSMATNSIWIGTYDNGIARYTGNAWESHPFPNPGTLLYEMKIAANGNIWCATDNGLYKWANNQFTQYSNNFMGAWDIDLFPNGKILCASNQPYIYDPILDTFKILTSTCFSYASGTVYVKNDSTYYFATDRGELAVFNDTTEVDTIGVGELLIDLQTNAAGNLVGLGNSRVLYEKHGHLLDTIAFGNNTFTTFLAKADGSLLGAGVNNDYGKLLILDNQNHTEEISLRKSGLMDNWVYKFATAEDGNMLITSRSGIQKFDVNANDFTQEWRPDTVTTTFAEALQLNGDLYVGTSTNRLLRYRNNQWEHLGDSVLPSNEVSHLTRDQSGNLWMGGPGYVAKYDGIGFTVYNAANAPVITNNLYIRDIYCDSTNNTVWIATYSGIIRFTNGAFTLLNDTNTVGIQQFYGVIETITEDTHHNIWFGTVYGGLIKYDGSDFSTTLLPIHVGNQLVSSIAFIGDTMYISDNLNGIWIYANSQFDSLNTRTSEITDDFVYDLNVDRKGNLWIAHLQYGIDIYNKNGVTISKVEEVADLSARVYPNPSTGKFLLETKDQNADISIYDLTGNLVQQIKSIGNKTLIDLSGQAQGMYFANVKTATGNQTIKLIVQ